MTIDRDLKTGKAEGFLQAAAVDESRKNQGRLKIYLGMVAGVGKTFAMLTAAHSLKKSGLNVMVGAVETHGRKETQALLEGLTLIPPKKISYRGRDFEEMDLDTILSLRPQVVVVDELAHTNVPNSRHAKRYQDVMEILGQGIDVYTAINIQHIESRSGTVEEIANVDISEKVPDSIIDRADEILLVDLAPDQIIERLKTGKIYPEEKIKVSLENFFSKNNLTALREVALRLVADRVDSELKNLKLIHGVPQVWKANHKILVPLYPSNRSEYLVRWARRLASNLSCPWAAVYVETNRELNEEQKEHIKRAMDLVKQLGGEMLQTKSEDEVKGVIRTALNHQVTKIILGKPRKYGLSFFLGQRFWQRLFKQSGNIDLYFLGLSKDQAEKNYVLPPHWYEIDTRKLFMALVGVGIITLIGLPLGPIIGYRAIGMMYLIMLNLSALYLPTIILILVTIISSICWNFIFIPPRFTFAINSVEDWMMLIAFSVATLITSTLVSRLKKNERFLLKKEEESSSLYYLMQGIFSAKNFEDIIKIYQEKVEELFNSKTVIYLKDTRRGDTLNENSLGNFIADEREYQVAQWCFKNKAMAGKFTETLPTVNGMYFPLLGPKDIWGVMGIVPQNPKIIFHHDEQMLLENFSRQLALSFEREYLQQNIRESLVSEETQRIYRTLLSSISHELKTPLAAISGPATALIDAEIAKNPTTVRELSEQILYGANRMQGLVQNLLDMSRLDAGRVKLNLESCELPDLIAHILDQVEIYYGKRKFVLDYATSLPLVQADRMLLEQALGNIIQNACIYSPSDRPIVVRLNQSTKHNLEITIEDKGPGLPKQNPNIVFEKFYRADPSKPGGTGLGLTIAKAIVELHHGHLEAKNKLDGGACFIMKLPLEYRDSQEGPNVS